MNARIPDQCPTGCGRPVRRGRLMCGMCWRLVPKHLQRDVNRTWLAYSRAAGPDIADRRAAYTAARTAAIASVP